MVSRRGFLRVAGGAAVVGATGWGEAVGDAGEASSLPVPIAALASFAGKVAPISNDERRARIERAKQLMTENKMDAIVLANNSTSSMYFANISLNGGERLWGLGIPAKPKPLSGGPPFVGR